MMLTSIADAKARAKALRAQNAAAGVAISHAQALEMVARQNGARDWNTLHARLAKERQQPLCLDDVVTGRYLGQPFEGRIVALTMQDEGLEVTIRLDRPVDTVRFDSFSNLRRQIRGIIDANGRSASKTSDGVPQLVVAKRQHEGEGPAKKRPIADPATVSQTRR